MGPNTMNMNPHNHGMDPIFQRSHPTLNHKAPNPKLLKPTETPIALNPKRTDTSIYLNLAKLVRERRNLNLKPTSSFHQADYRHIPRLDCPSCEP